MLATLVVAGCSADSDLPSVPDEPPPAEAPRWLVLDCSGTMTSLQIGTGGTAGYVSDEACEIGGIATNQSALLEIAAILGPEARTIRVCVEPRHEPFEASTAPPGDCLTSDGRAASLMGAGWTGVLYRYITDGLSHDTYVIACLTILPVGTDDVGEYSALPPNPSPSSACTKPGG